MLKQKPNNKNYFPPYSLYVLFCAIFSRCTFCWLRVHDRMICYETITQIKYAQERYRSVIGAPFYPSSPMYQITVIRVKYMWECVFYCKTAESSPKKAYFCPHVFPVLRMKTSINSAHSVPAVQFNHSIAKDKPNQICQWVHLPWRHCMIYIGVLWHQEMKRKTDQYFIQR